MKKRIEILYWVLLAVCAAFSALVIIVLTKPSQYPGVIHDSQHVTGERDKVRVFHIYPDSSKLKVNPYEKD